MYLSGNILQLILPPKRKLEIPELTDQTQNERGNCDTVPSSNLDLLLKMFEFYIDLILFQLDHIGNHIFESFHIILIELNIKIGDSLSALTQVFFF